jgi:hypothetical protein
VASHDFRRLFEHYPAVIDQMPETFTSHQFILRLAQQRQALYIDALHTYQDTTAPFKNVHRALAQHLNACSGRVTHTGDVQSSNIFGAVSNCAQWRKVEQAATAHSTPASTGSPARSSEASSFSLSQVWERWSALKAAIRIAFRSNAG